MRAGLAGASVFLAPCAAQAAQFEVHRLASPTRAVIFASGKIAKGDLPRFQKALREARPGRPEAPPLLVLHSPGGDIEEAFAIGRSVKRNGVATAILSGSFCASACTLIFFAGYDPKTKAPDRTVYGSAKLGVHRWGQLLPISGWDPRRPLSPSILDAMERRAKRDFKSYFAEMRISAEIGRRTYETPNKSVYLLTTDDMIASAITVRTFADTPHVGGAPIQFGCKPACQPREVARSAAAASSTGVVRQSATAASVSGAAYLQAWSTLIGRRVRIADCTFWLPSEAEAPCVVQVGGKRLGFVLVAASTPARPGWTLIRERCSTPEPIEDCRVELTGTVRATPSGPVLVQANAQFLQAAEDRSPPPPSAKVSEAGSPPAQPATMAVHPD